MNESGKAFYVSLYRNQQIVARCQVNYLGFSGINVAVNPMLFPKGSQVDVMITNRRGDSDVLDYVLPAVVTTRSPEGVGLTFLISEGEPDIFLRGMMSRMHEYQAAI